MNLQQLTAEYTELNNDLNKVKDRIDMRNRQIERLEKKKEKAEGKSHWTKFANNIMELVSNRTLDVIWNIDKIPTTTGLRCQYYIFGKTIEDDVTVGICFTPGKDNSINYDTKEQKGNFHPNSIGYANGFQNVSKTVESIDELVELTYDSIREERKIREEKHDDFKGKFIEGEDVIINNRERGILHEYLEPGFCNIFFPGDRGVEKVRVYNLRKPTEWERSNPESFETHYASL
jgi:hypothetical protein